MSFFAELKRRNIFRVGLAYAGAAWVLLQSLDVVAPLLDLPDSTAKIAFTLLAIGFIPAIIFAWAFEITPEGLMPAKQVDRAESITIKTGRKLDLTIIAVLSIAVVLLLVDRFVGQAPTDTEEIAEKSIAVLPFVNMSSDAEQEFFSDGITEEILNALAAVRGLKVAGRTSSFAFKGQNQDLREIGDTLGVEHILEGSVRKSGSKIRITAQLIQVEDGFHMWSDTYDRELTDIFAIQDEIAAEILAQLKTRLLDDQLEALTSRRTDPKAYELYLLAKQRMYRRTHGAIESAAELLEETIAIDPEYAPAYAQLGIVSLLLSERSYGSVPRDEAGARAKQFIDKAIQLDDKDAEAWAGLGLYHETRPSEHEQAIEALTRALSLNPNLIDAANWLQNALRNSGDVRGAMEILRHMTSRDPLYRPGFGNAVNVLNSLGLADESQRLIDQYAQYDPNDAQLLRAQAMQNLFAGNVAEGLRQAEAAHAREPSNVVMATSVHVGWLMTLQVDRLAEANTGRVQSSSPGCDRPT